MAIVIYRGPTPGDLTRDIVVNYDRDGFAHVHEDAIGSLLAEFGFAPDPTSLRPPHTFPPGAVIHEAAGALATLARVTGVEQVGVFNDTPLVARPGVSVVDVLDAWHSARRHEA